MTDESAVRGAVHDTRLRPLTSLTPASTSLAPPSPTWRVCFWAVNMVAECSTPMSST